jgi:hypothetical protein
MSSNVRIAVSQSIVSKLFRQHKADIIPLLSGWDLWKNWQWKVFTCDVAVSYGGRV